MNLNYQELLLFIVAALLTGGIIFLDAYIVGYIYRGRSESKKSMIRLAIYIILGIGLVLIPVKAEWGIWVIRICRVFGEAFMLTGFWKLYKYSTEAGTKLHEHRIVGCDGTGDCKTCGRIDSCAEYKELLRKGKIEDFLHKD